MTKNLTNAERRAMLKKIEANMAAEVLKETGAAVEFTCVGVNKWSMVGAENAVNAAIAWMAGNGTATENDRVSDDEDGDVYVYFTTHAS